MSTTILPIPQDVLFNVVSLDFLTATRIIGCLICIVNLTLNFTLFVRNWSTPSCFNLISKFAQSIWNRRTSQTVAASTANDEGTHQSFKSIRGLLVKIGASVALCDFFTSSFMFAAMARTLAASDSTLTNWGELKQFLVCFGRYHFD